MKDLRSLEMTWFVQHEAGSSLEAVGVNNLGNPMECHNTSDMQVLQWAECLMQVNDPATSIC
ncbi:hypothetical protein D3C77_745160 [compost metagenome]